MTDENDLIRRGDAILAVSAADRDCLGANGAREFIRALPAAPIPLQAAMALPEIAALVAAARKKLAFDAWVAKVDGVTPEPLRGSTDALLASLRAIDGAAE